MRPIIPNWPRMHGPALSNEYRSCNDTSVWTHKKFQPKIMEYGVWTNETNRDTPMIGSLLNILTSKSLFLAWCFYWCCSSGYCDSSVISWHSVWKSVPHYTCSIVAWGDLFTLGGNYYTSALMAWLGWRDVFLAVCCLRNVCMYENDARSQHSGYACYISLSII